MVGTRVSAAGICSIAVSTPLLGPLKMAPFQKPDWCTPMNQGASAQPPAAAPTASTINGSVITSGLSCARCCRRASRAGPWNTRNSRRQLYSAVRKAVIEPSAQP